jgi:hypothetical protein
MPADVASAKTGALSSDWKIGILSVDYQIDFALSLLYDAGGLNLQPIFDAWKSTQCRVQVQVKVLISSTCWSCVASKLQILLLP